MLNGNSDSTVRDVKEYYGEVLSSKDDLKTSACCVADDLPEHIKEILPEIADEVQEKFYGCGSPIPLGIEGLTVLDLGSGTGRDCYILSKLVGEKGRVIGVDMTEAQYNIAVAHQDYHAEKFGYSKSNVQFHLGYIEDLQSLGIQDGSVDLVISNCVINLSPYKREVFKEIFRVLKPGGQLYFSDLFSDRRIPLELTKDPVLMGECLSGAMYTEDFRRELYDLGCPDFRTISSRELQITEKEIRDKMGAVKLFSKTVSAFKLDDLEDQCEDYGQVAVYKGSIPGAPHQFVLDNGHTFQAGKPELVCGNTASMVGETRFAPHFEVIGDRSVHYGLFDGCGGYVTSDPGTESCC